MDSEPTYSVNQDANLPNPTPTPDDTLASSVAEKNIEELVRDDQVSTMPPASRKKVFRFRIPIAFARTVFEFYHCRSISGWDTRFRMRNVVPRDSPLFELARRADMDGVMALFQAGLASPFDVDTLGRTAIESCLTIENGRSSLQKIFQFIKFLVAQADHDIAVIGASFMVSISICLDHDHDLMTELYIHIYEQVDLAGCTMFFMTLAGGSPAVMRDLIRRMEPPLHSHPLKSRLEMALRSTQAYYYGCRHIISGFNARLGCELTGDNVLGLVFSDSSGYLKRLLRVFGIAFARGDNMARARLVKVIESGDKFRSDWTGSMASFMTSHLRTLDHIFEGSCDTQSSSICTTHMLTFQNKVSEAMLIWLSCLDEAAINLKHYGRREVMAVRNATTTGSDSHVYDLPLSWDIRCLEPFSTLKVVGFDISHRPESWKAQFSWRLNYTRVWECLAGEFWDLVESFEKSCHTKAIPGSWDPKWNCDKSYIWRPGFNFNSNRTIPNRGWRVEAAKATAMEEAVRAGMSTMPKWLVQQHRKRLRRGAILWGRYVSGGRQWWSEQDRGWHYDDT